MLLTEFRIPMPFTLDEYRRGQIYTTIQASLMESTNSEGFEVIKNEPFSSNLELPLGYRSGQYTMKVYNFANRFPFFIRALAPKSVMVLNEDSWNAYPYTRTVVSNRKMDKDFFIKIDTFHCEGRLDQENAHSLGPELLGKRKVIIIDIGNDSLSENWKGDSPEPSEFISRDSSRGPLTGDWIQNVEPIMTCYKLVQVSFKWLGLQGPIERFIMKTEKKLFTSFHRRMFVWMDDWYDLTNSQLRAMETNADRDLAYSRRRTSPYQTSTPRTQNEDTPKTKNEDDARTLNEDAPRTENEDVPNTENEDAPRTENEVAPSTENEDAPRTENEDSPRTVNEDAPRTENEDSPRNVNEDAPRTENEDAIRTQNEDAPSTGNEDVPSTENEDAPRTENEDAPSTGNEEASSTENEEALSTENEDAQSTENEDAPSTENEDAPRTENEDAPRTVNEDAPRTENEDAIRTQNEDVSRTKNEDAGRSKPIEE